MNRDRCWIVHRKREIWRNCPLCGAPIAWVKVKNSDDGEWSPCDEEPVMISVGQQTRKQAVLRNELWKGCRKYIPGRDKKRPMFGRFPHYYTCAVLLKERKEYAIARRRNHEGDFI